MSKFATERVEEIKAREVVEQLIMDDVKQLNSFEASLNGTTYLSEYRTILKFIEHLANGNSLPKKKFRHLHGVKDGVSEYEFKSKHLRVYAIQQPSRKIIIYLGYKITQDKDIESFRSLKKQFLDYIKTIENEKKRFNKKS